MRNNNNELYRNDKVTNKMQYINCTLIYNSYLKRNPKTHPINSSYSIPPQTIKQFPPTHPYNISQASILKFKFATLRNRLTAAPMNNSFTLNVIVHEYVYRYTGGGAADISSSVLR